MYLSKLKRGPKHLRGTCGNQKKDKTYHTSVAHAINALPPQKPCVTREKHFSSISGGEALAVQDPGIITVQIRASAATCQLSIRWYED